MNQENNNMNTMPNADGTKAVYPTEYQAPSKTADAYTFDYNKVYNVESNPIPSENNSTSNTRNGLVSDEVYNPLSNNFVSDTNPVTPMSVSNVTPANYNVDSSFESLKMAAPPSFDLPNDDKEEVITPVIPEVQKEDLVSIDIIEPSALPVGNAVRDSMYPPNSVNNPPLGGNTQQPTPHPSVNNPVSAGEMNPFMANNVAPSRIDNGGMGNAGLVSPPNAATPMPNMNPNPTPVPPTPTPAPVSNQGLVADPMSIFGVQSGLRPTAGEALREQSPADTRQVPTDVRQAPTPSDGIGVCPNCGFSVKQGQPICVVCGYRFK